MPLVSVVIGEGGSGGALAIASADRVYMLENSVYSVITPEGCASILWRSNTNAQDAADAMKMTAQDLKKLEVIDEVIPEPMGGAHRAPDETIDSVGKVIAAALDELSKLDPDTLAPPPAGKVPRHGQEGPLSPDAVSAFSTSRRSARAARRPKRSPRRSNWLSSATGSAITAIGWPSIIAARRWRARRPRC